MAFNYLINEQGNPEVPQSVKDSLRSVSPRLGAFWHAGLSQFALTLTWAEDAPQRKLIAEGLLSPESDFEIVGWLPPYVSLEDASGYAMNVLGVAATQRHDIKRMMHDREHQLQKQNDAAFETAADNLMINTLYEVGDGKNIQVGKRRQRVAVTDVLGAASEVNAIPTE